MNSQKSINLFEMSIGAMIIYRTIIFLNPLINKFSTLLLQWLNFFWLLGFSLEFLAKNVSVKHY